MNKKKQYERMLKRFWSRVNKGKPDECWLWKGATNGKGYGVLKVDGKNMLAHRLSWILVHGPIPESDTYHGVCILHKCDNRSCVNPRHLFDGTQGDNMNDMSSKKRGRSGIQKLSPQQVAEIKIILSQEKRPSLRKIASLYNVSHNAIWFIDKDISYRN